MSAVRAPLSGGRWHFQQGPIDVVIAAEGRPDAVAASHAAAWLRFTTVLTELVAELPPLRQPISANSTFADAAFRGRVARRMWAACWPYRDAYITPMAAVAGAVAQELIVCYQREGVDRAWVNNGGDIAWHLAAGQVLRLGLFADLSRWREAFTPSLSGDAGLPTDAQWLLTAEQPAKGAATSGWRGRSFSLGIADSVTVLADSAAQADAAATVIANAVTVQSPLIVRRPACDLKDDSDLGTIPVTVDVPELPAELVKQALSAGLAKARDLQHAGLIWFSSLFCQGQWLSTGDPRWGSVPPSGQPFASIV